MGRLTSWQEESSAKALERALGTFDHDATKALVDAFVAHVREGRAPISDAHAHEVLLGLRRRREFELMTRAADALVESGSGSLRVRCDCVQSLVDQGLGAAAEAMVHQLVRDTGRELAVSAEGSDARTHALELDVEARGLLGRVYKQRYVRTSGAGHERAVAALRTAIAAYHEVYAERQADPSRRWHGINAVALALRVQSDHPALEIGFQPTRIARDLVDAVKRDTRGPWDHAVAMEASLALGEGAEAIRWGRLYVDHSELDAFAVAGTLRQLEEIWRLRPSESPGAELVAMLQAKLLSCAGGAIAFDGGEPQSVRLRVESLHRVFDAGFMPGEVYRLGFECAQSVARLGRSEHQGVGTGVLVRGGDLHEPLGDELCLLTNSHVVAKDPAPWPYELRVGEAVASFLFGKAGTDEALRIGVRDVIWQSSLWQLDVALLRLDHVPATLRACRIRALPAWDPSRPERVYLAGYPNGGSLKFSLSDNVVLDRDERFLHYRAAADKGSSGSPVFDSDFRLVALHHLGSSELIKLDRSGKHAANEGVLVSAIASALRTELGARHA
jgi:hypothetical protein